MKAEIPGPGEVRAAVAADAAAIAAIEVETWRDTYAAILPQAWLLRMHDGRRARQWAAEIAACRGDVLVATDAAGTVRGFGSCGVPREAGLGCAGEVFTLYVAPEAQGEGRGRALLLGLLRRLLGTGRRSAVVWVLRDNPARFFYERQGGILAGQRRIPFAGAAVDGLGYAWRDLEATLARREGTGRRI